MEHSAENGLEQAAHFLRVLGHPMRLALIHALKDRQRCVCELASSLGLHKSAASKHLSLLKSIGVVEMTKQGTQVICSLIMPCIFDMIRCAKFFDEPVDNPSQPYQSCTHDTCITGNH